MWEEVNTIGQIITNTQKLEMFNEKAFHFP